MSIKSTMLATIGRCYPFYSGNFRIVNSRLARSIIGSIVDTLWCPTPGGPLLVPLNDEVGRCIYFTGDYDRKITWVCRRVVRAGDTVIDVGANLGLVTLALAQLVGRNGKVLAFEPNPRMQALIEASLLKAKHTNVVLHKVGLGSGEAEMDLYVPSGNVGQGSFLYHQHASNKEIYKCRILRLSDVVKRECIGNIRLIKIDVEGYESEVLTGAHYVLEVIRPDIIILETNEASELRFRDRPAILTLREHRYRFLAIPKAILSMKVVEFSPDCDEPPSHDVIAIPTEKYAEVSSRLGVR